MCDVTWLSMLDLNVGKGRQVTKCLGTWAACKRSQSVEISDKLAASDCLALSTNVTNSVLLLAIVATPIYLAH